MNDRPAERTGLDAEAEDRTPPTDGRRFRFPTALTILGLILLIVWVVTFFVPSGSYDLDDGGGPVPGTYTELDACTEGEADARQGGTCVDKGLQAMIGQLWTAVPNGLYGIEEPETGFVSSSASGELFGAGQIFLFVLAIGSFITITMRTGAIDAGLGRLLARFERSPTVLVIIVMAVFGIGGTTFGLWSETLGFFPLIVPLAVGLGYDRVTGVGIVLLGSGAGVLASTVNPFATGIASDAAGTSISDGLVIRLVMWVTIMATTIGFVLWYGNRVRRDPSTSVLATDHDRRAAGDLDPADVPDLTGARKAVLIIFGLAFLIMIYGFVPWDDFWIDLAGTEFPLPTMADMLGDFFFAEAAVLFLVAAVAIGLVDRMAEQEIVDSIVDGAADFLSAGLVIVAARAITVLMKGTFVTDTVLHVMEGAVDQSSPIGFASLAWVANIPVAFLVPSSSGHAGLVMPILGPVAGFAEVNPSVAVTAYQSASGWVNLITPTSAVTLSGLTLAKVGYHQYLRFVWPYMVATFVLISAFVAASAVIS